MNVLILEDESRAASHLERLIRAVAPDMTVVGKVETVRESIDYLNTIPQVSLIFSDVQLADGLSFDNGLRLDVLVEDLIICELKAIEILRPVHTSQILTYLKPMLTQALPRMYSLHPGYFLSLLNHP